MSKNIYVQIGFSEEESEVLIFKGKLMSRVLDLFTALDMPPEAFIRAYHLDRAVAKNILQGHISQVTFDQLLSVLLSLGEKVTPTFSKVKMLN